MKLTILLASLCLFSLPAVAQQMTPQELELWFNSPPDQSAAHVSEGELRFLATPPAKAVHHHKNRLTLKNSSLLDGWADLTQCHENLDRVPSAQIVYRAGSIRKLTVQSYSGIEKVWVDGASVQMTNIGAGARLCITAQTRVLTQHGDGTYSVSNGPYKRSFLDGYYPMRVSMHVDYPPQLIQVISVFPAEQPGFHIWKEKDSLGFDALFEGELYTQIRFRRVSPSPR